MEEPQHNTRNVHWIGVVKKYLCVVCVTCANTVCSLNYLFCRKLFFFVIFQKVRSRKSLIRVSELLLIIYEWLGADFGVVEWFGVVVKPLLPRYWNENEWERS
jgi:hypothetical protein